MRYTVIVEEGATSCGVYAPDLPGTRPRPRGCKKLQGSNNLWQIRIGEYRVVYEIRESGKHIDVIVVRHRSEAYR